MGSRVSALEFTIGDIAAEIRSAFTGKGLRPKDTALGQMAIAATATVHDAGELLKTQGRQSIAQGGLSRKWQNAWRVDYFPKRGVSLDAAAFAHHNIAYASVFETGATLRPRRADFIWLPLPTAPRGRGVKGNQLRITPAQLAKQGVKLVSMTKGRHGDKPMLGAAIRVSGSGIGNRASVAGGRGLSIATLRKGTVGKRGRVVTVPLFVGVTSVNIRKRFDLTGVYNRTIARLPEFYTRRIAEARVGE